jgi:hypothetical protein
MLFEKFDEIGARLIVGDAVGHRVDVYPNIINGLVG